MLVQLAGQHCMRCRSPWPPSALSMTFRPRKKLRRSPGLAVQLLLVKPCEAVVIQM